LGVVTDHWFARTILSIHGSKTIPLSVNQSDRAQVNAIARVFPNLIS
jgi:hypothetical protein